ncbi:hypothetical protein BKA64DRAFT_136234 [Cadophora sp. MPI-SDFR-AT-0126]|nr:hypothetical protein BKA64DRAFT_136234 [Leotiomycetes sp. MPI-SDFR-AT-0126]
MKTHVSCDRCHRIKAKCAFTPGSAYCGRCSRLEHHCTTARVSAQRGRRRKDEKLLVSKDKTDTLVWVVDGNKFDPVYTNHGERSKKTVQNAQNPQGHHQTPPGSCLIQLPPPEDQLVAILWSDHFVSDFVIGPSFTCFFQDMLQRSFANSPGVLRDTYLATAAAFVQVRRGEPGNESLNLNRTSMSIERLRHFQAKDSSQFALLIGLGLSIVTFEILTASTFSQAIVAHTLLSLKPWFPLTTSNPDLDFNLDSLILMDTINCAMYRGVPIIRYEADMSRVDRSVGLCCGLLPIMYDICLISHKQRHGSRSDRVQIASSWAEMVLRVQKWHPVEPPGFLENYRDNEVVALRTQASTYQNAVFLLIHRLQHPYDGIDDVAMSWSRGILSSLETCFRVTGSYPLPTFFPLLVASLEVCDYHTRNEIMEATKTRFQPVFHQFLIKMKHFLKYVWEGRDSGYVLSWDQIIHAVPKIFFLP